MMYGTVPENYEQWHHCITVDCAIPLTSEFVMQRLKIWRDENAEETLRFRRLYGDAHWREVVGWFERAEAQLD